MRTFGVGIFDNDVAQAVREEFKQHVADGLSVFAAADRILTKPLDPLKESDRAHVYLALASLQLDHGVIQPKIKKNALTVIIVSDEMERWEDCSPEVVKARKKILEDLRQRLLETQ